MPILHLAGKASIRRRPINSALGRTHASDMLLRIAAALAFTAALAGVALMLARRFSRSGAPSYPSAFRLGYVFLGASAWLTLASTALLWVFPLSVVASATIGYLGTKGAKISLQGAEVKALVLLPLVSGAAIAVAMATYGDPFLLQVATPYSVLNTIAMVGTAYLTLRHTSAA